MKRKLILSVIIFFGLAFLVIICDFSDDIAGIWKGSYTASQGETGLTLNVYNAGDQYKAIFVFYNLPGRTNAKDGKYYMYGSYNESTKIYNFIGYEWIEHPDYYVFVDLKGKITGNIFSGSVIISKNSLETNQSTYSVYYAKLSEEIEKPIYDAFTFRVVKKSKNILRGLIHRIWLLF
jgi:hypothetical protein